MNKKLLSSEQAVLLIPVERTSNSCIPFRVPSKGHRVRKLDGVSRVHAYTISFLYLISIQDEQRVHREMVM